MPRIIVVYDVSDNNKRTKLSNYLKSKGLVRVQRSMFIGRVSSQTLKDVERGAKRIIDSGTDIVHIIPLTAYGYTHMKVLGNPLNKVGEEKTVVI